LERWTKSILAKEGRVPTLFSTIEGLPGHVTQLNQELLRVSNGVKSWTEPKVHEAAEKAQRIVYDAVVKVKNKEKYNEKIELNFELLDDKL